MADAVDPIESRRPTHDRYDRIEAWVRRGIMCLLLGIVIVALTNTVGQRATTSHAASALASIELRAPATVRPGLLFQARITITVRQPLPRSELVLSHGWIDGLTLNTAEPSPSTQTSGPDGSLVFDLGELSPGATFTQYLDYQVNPTSISSRTQVMTLVSEGSPVVSLHRTMTIVP